VRWVFTLFQCLPGLVSLSRRLSLLFNWCRASSPSHVVAVELQGQLPAGERELDSREDDVVAREVSLVASECTLGRACAECDTDCDRAEAIHQDYQTRIRAFTAGYRHSFNFDWILEERRILPSLQEMDLERWENLEEQARGHHSFDGMDLSVELEELCEHVAGVEREHATEAMTLS
jgi:hypothetical protein